MSSTSSSVVFDDDEEVDYEDEVWRAQRFGNNRKTGNRIIDDSDELGSSSEEDEKLESLEKSGRLTPSIQKAIRRSIFNLSLSNSDGQTDDEGVEENLDNQNRSDTTNKNGMIDSSNNSHNDEASLNENVEEINDQEVQDSSVNSIQSIVESSHEHIDLTQDSFQENEQRKSVDSNRFSNLLDESHKTDTEEEGNRSITNSSYKLVEDTHYSSPEATTDISEKSYPDVEVIRPQSILEHIDSSSSSIEISHIDSATEESINEEDHPEVINIAKQELNGTTLDHKSAQKKALLAHRLSKINVDLQHMNIIASNKQQMDHLPDKGKKLLISIANLSKERDIAKTKLEELDRLERTNGTSPQSNLSRLRNELMEQSYVSSIMLGSHNKYPNSQLDSSDDGSMKILNKPTLDHNIDGLGKQALKTLETQQALTVDRLQDLHGSLVTRPTENEEAPDPRGLRVKLMPHQKHALAWLLWRENQKPAGGVLADDMGLGKTLTMISLVMATKDDSFSDEENEDGEWINKKKTAKFSGGTLVVCPASLVAQWAAEVKNRCKAGELVVEVYHGNNRTSSARTLAKNDIVITTYQLLAREVKANAHSKMLSINWKRVILDEAHVIRNRKSQTCEAVCNLNARKRWALTGTPIHNKELDLYSILKFLKCSPFDDLKVWKRWVDNKNAAGHERLATVMKSLMLRRTKQELMTKGQLDTLPEKFVEEIKVDLDPEERLIYEKLLVFSQTLFAQFLAQRAEKEHMFEMGAGKFNRPFMETSTISTKFNKAQMELMRQHKEVKSHMILALILRLRQVCCHPSLIHSMLDRDDIETNGLENETGQGDLLSQMNQLRLHDAPTDDDNHGDLGLDERVKENLLTSENPVFNSERISSKFRVIMKIVKEILAKKEKLIIVSQWTSNLNILASFLSTIKGATYKMFTGAVAIKNRQQIVDDFNDQSGGPQILLLSLTAGGVGLNLIGANHLMLIDIHWNPQLESQAQDRIYRFGQKKNVFVYKLICNGTIEERIKNLQERKLSLATNVLGGSGKVSSKLTLADLRSLFNM